MGSLIFPQFQQADFIRAMQEAQLYRMREVELAKMNAEAMAKQQELARQPVLMRLQGEALQNRQGSMQQLQLVAPKLAMDTSEHIAEQKKRDFENSEHTRKEIVRQTGRQLALLRQVQSRPELLQPTIRYMVDAKLMSPDIARQLGDTNVAPRILESVIGELERNKIRWDDPTSQKDLTEYGRLLNERTAAKDAGNSELVGLYDERIKRMNMPPGKGFTFNNYDGAVPTGTAAMNKLQQDQVDDSIMLGSLRSLEGMMTVDPGTGQGDVDKLLSLKGRGQVKLAGLADQLGWLSGDSEYGDLLSKAQTLEGTVGELFNMYRKYVTGAAASDQEIKRLAEQMLNTSMGGVRFRAAYKQLKDKVLRAMRIRHQLMRKGFSDPTDPAYMAQYNDMWGVSESLQGPAAREARGAELVAQYTKGGRMSQQEAIRLAAKQMETEGYFTDSELQAIRDKGQP